MRIYTDVMTVGGRDVGVTFVSLDPRVPTDASSGTYATWAEAHAALLALPAGRKTMYVFTGGVDIIIPAGAWEMLGISLVGDDQTVNSVVLETAPVGVTFLNWTEGCSNITFRHTGAAALMTFTTGLVTFRTGKHAGLQATGAGPIFFVDGTGEDSPNLFILVEDLAGLSGGAGTEFLAMNGEAAFVSIYLFDGTNIGASSIRGDADGTLSFIFYGVGPVLTAQPAFLGTTQIIGGADKVSYYNEDGEADWSGAPPTNVGAAIARLAAAFNEEFGPV